MDVVKEQSGVNSHFLQLWHTPLFMQHMIHNYPAEVMEVSYAFHLIHIN